MKPLHDRMPVILSSNDYNFWLNTEANEPAKLDYLYEPFPDSELIATPPQPWDTAADIDDTSRVLEVRI